MMEDNPESDHQVLNTKSRKLKVMTGIMSKISVEPTVFLTVFTSMMYQLTSQNVYLEKACRVNIGFNSSTCDALTTRNRSGYSRIEEIEVQKLVSKMLGLRTVLQSFVPFCLMLFVGSWTDRHNRRKPLILTPIIGEIFCCVLLILNIIFFYELPLIFTTLGDSLPLALLGGWPCFFVGTYTLVGAQCDPTSRTTRMAILSVLQMTGFSLGMGLAGLIHASFGFIGFFSFCICILITSFLLGMFLVKEKTTTPHKEKDTACSETFSIFTILWNH
ncbi:hypothetical protein WA026_004214 [Henosepilachna vigintioctopunctata]|uniref:Solute carrier family 46 member 3 n=1 Tax=Henosepilachna vigintioctopunctata TaxID=420089 RepID=A0AAW1UF08_9CUCU